MIPQEAVLIEGTLRENLDPFNQLQTDELEKVLTKVGLSSSMLNQQVGTGGGNLSVGERQVCLCVIYVYRYIDRSCSYHMGELLIA
jgi:ABC-type multidrug transport system fused ATPase/permease subunit